MLQTTNHNNSLFTHLHFRNNLFDKCTNLTFVSVIADLPLFTDGNGKTGLKFISDPNNHSLVGNPPAGRLRQLMFV
ncbi:MAG: hypothetical protein LBT09_05560 [Planctomycetaceae bacterium]|nr:hypothetical protein [Planctomycetaceae bacterium]